MPVTTELEYCEKNVSTVKNGLIRCCTPDAYVDRRLFKTTFNMIEAKVGNSNYCNKYGVCTINFSRLMTSKTTLNTC